MPRKVYVDVLAQFDTEGQIKPRVITFEDGSKYQIDRILDIRNAASLKVGGAGVRYKCRIAQVETFIFLEENRWFVEAKV